MQVPLIQLEVLLVFLALVRQNKQAEMQIWWVNLFSDGSEILYKIDLSVIIIDSL